MIAGEHQLLLGILEHHVPARVPGGLPDHQPAVTAGQHFTVVQPAIRCVEGHAELVGLPREPGDLPGQVRRPGPRKHPDLVGMHTVGLPCEGFQAVPLTGAEQQFHAMPVPPADPERIVVPVLMGDDDAPDIGHRVSELVQGLGEGDFGRWVGPARVDEREPTTTEHDVAVDHLQVGQGQR